MTCLDADPACADAQLCAGCLGRARIVAVGMARAAGAVWAEAIARQHPELRGREAWPADERALELARHRVRSLAQDPRLVEELARACVEGAVEWWGRRPGRHRSG